MSHDRNQDLAASGEEDVHNHGAEDDDLPTGLGHAGAVTDKAIEYMLGQGLEPVAVASALLGGALGLLAGSMEDGAILRVLENAMASVRAGELAHIRAAARDAQDAAAPEHPAQG
jgi:hypothetical protein